MHTYIFRYIIIYIPLSPKELLWQNIANVVGIDGSNNKGTNTS